MQRPKGNEGVRLWLIWRKNFPESQNCKRKGPETGKSLVCLRHSNKAVGWSGERQEEIGEGDEE